LEAATPPMIQFMPDPKNAWKKDIPRTIDKPDKKQVNKKNNSSKTYSLDNDNNTTTTVNTQSSYTQDTISELQNNSHQHQQLLESHTRRIKAINNTIANTTQYQDRINNHTERLDQLDSTNQAYNQRLDSINDYVREQLSTFTNNLATLEEEQQIQQRQQDQMTRDIAS
jgi:chromosome segregation ATPase